MIRAGRLDQVIEVQGLTKTTDSMGATVETWAKVSSSPTRAEYIPLRGSERVEMGKLGTVHPAKFRIRRWSSLDQSQQIVHDGKTYRILDFDDNYRRGLDMIIYAEEVL